MSRYPPGVFALLLAACGYPGEPLPPALHRPVRIVDLAAVERGSKIIIHFTIPKITTEGLPVKPDEPLDLRIGPAGGGTFNVNTWASSAERISPAEIRREPPMATAEISAAPFYHKTIVIGVRALAPNGSDAGWSNLVSFPVIPALPVPADVAWKNAPDAVQLDWKAAAPEFRVFRKQTGTEDFNLLGTTNKPEYLDNAIEYGKSYDYVVQSVQKTDDEHYAESDTAEVADVKPIDTFAPAVPTGLTAVPGTRSIELVWNRNTEKDFASYRIFRNGELLAKDIAAPAYSDKNVEPGKTYSYQVTAVDNAGNESDKTAAVTAALP